MNLYEKLVNVPNPKILIIRMSSFGDIVKTIPFYYYLRKVLPHSIIYWLVKDKYVKLLQTFDILNNVLSSQPFNSLTFDTVFDLQSNLKSGLLSFLMPAKYRVGFSPRYTKELNFLLRSKIVNQLLVVRSHSSVTQNIALNKLVVNTYNKPFELAYMVGFPKITIPKIEPKISVDKEKKVKEWLNKHHITKFILIHPGSSKRGLNKRWAIENFVRLAKDIYQQYNTISVILFGKDEEQLKIFFKDYAAIPDFDVKLEEMIVLIRNCSLFIGNDSGPLHLASVLGTKSFGIYIASNPYIMAYSGSLFVSNHFHIEEKQSKYANQISYEKVWQKLVTLLNNEFICHY